MSTPAAKLEPRRFVVLATIAGAALRLAHLSSVAASTIPRWQWVEPESDYAFLWKWAAAIRQGDWLSANVVPHYVWWMKRAAPWEDWVRWYHGNTGYPQSPLYAYLVAAVTDAPNGTPFGIYVVQALVSVACIPVVYDLGRRWSGAQAGIIAAFLFAFSQVGVALDGFMLRDALAPPLVLGALAALERIRDHARPFRWAAIAGAALGLGALEKENILLLGVLSVPLAFWLFRQRETPARRGPWFAALAVAAGLTVVLTPLMVRNVSLGAGPLYMGRSGPEIIVMGLCVDPDCDAIGHSPPARIGVLMERSGGTVTGALWTMWEDAKDRRLLLARLLARRAWGLVSPYEAADNVDLDYLLKISPALNATVPSGVMVPLVLIGIGFALTPARRRTCAVGLVAIAAVGATLPLIPVLWRLRAGVTPIGIPLAGCAVAAWAAWFRVKRPAALGVLGATFCGIALLYAFPPKPLFRLRHFEAISAARVLAADGDVDGARAELDAFLEGAKRGKAESPQYSVPAVLEYRAQLRAKP